ncbi:MAG TPA: tetratricopeptide repeat protein [bacterium]|nr:tetratricopeptide repeat protein [bacterium]
MEHLKNVYPQAQSLVDQKNFREAIPLFDTLIAEDPRNAHLIFSRAFALLNDGRCEEALRDYNAVTELRPDWAPGFFQQGYTLFKLRRLPEAQKCFEKATEINPLSNIYLFKLAQTLFFLGEKSTALTTIERSLSLRSDYVNALSLKAQILAATGTSSQTLNAITDAANRVHPEKRAAILFSRAQAHTKAKNHAEALADMREALDLDPSNPIYRSRLAYQLFLQKNYGESLSVINEGKWYQEEPRRDLLETKGKIYAAQGNFSEAISAFLGAFTVADKATRPFIAVQLADAYQSIGDKASAMRYYREAGATDATRFYAEIQTAATILNGDRPDNAEPLLRRTLGADPENIPHYNLWERKFVAFHRADRPIAEYLNAHFPAHPMARAMCAATGVEPRTSFWEKVALFFLRQKKLGAAAAAGAVFMMAAIITYLV